ncbi:transposase [Mycobacteroides abscessus subsp. abscessus]|uniref:Transposase n=1 Tax=Mycobacteroides abscessus TaxID=36809 RepID=A0AB33TBF3_9MYCO|nr:MULTISPECIES: hypothetical protein [Mycobacteroides]MBE5465159.1 hypothetical protein [Mycobacteroides abscessus]MBN7531639.1 hypothetical protein [Mycobacteroides abscessus subsp. abscessus]MDO2970552.1 hypothetical protein [Mycobacteroides abscessus subsp. bolletii]MDO3077937.1 hypothetical protein [Mycobacteroides abscessus subsp. bolletii]MDO3105957.1 hypothetical protein [Mycobacteroides abscessus subsp. abscessus]
MQDIRRYSTPPQLDQPPDRHHLEAPLKKIHRYKLIIVDEADRIPFAHAAANLVCQLDERDVLATHSCRTRDSCLSQSI